MDNAELRKAAIVLASLNHETAAEVCRQMSEVEAEMLLNEVALLGTVTRDEQKEALSHFRSQLAEATRVGGRDLAEELMSVTLGRRNARYRKPEQQAALEQLRRLNNTAPHALRRLLAGETPQMAALVLGQLSPEKAAELLMIWPEDERGDVALRVAKQGLLAPGAAEAIGQALGEHVYRDSEEGREDVGVGFVVKFLAEMDRSSGKALIDQVRSQDEELADEVEDQLFTFEDVAQLRDEDIQLVLRNVEPELMARALKGVDDHILHRVLRNLSTRMQEVLKQEIELLGPVLVKEVETAQKEVVTKALELEEAREIVLAAQEDEYIE